MNHTIKIKLLKGLTVISGIVTFILAFGDYILMGLLKLMLHVDVPKGEAASVGIIGGADGPTAIFIAGTSPLGNKNLGALISFLVFAVCVFRLRKYKRTR